MQSNTETRGRAMPSKTECECEFPDECCGLGVIYCDPPCGGDTCDCHCGGEVDCEGCAECDVHDVEYA